MNDNPADLHVRYLENQLAAQQAVGAQLWKQGFAEGLRHSQIEVPETFTSALRYGSAQEHVSFPLADGRVTVVLARTGSGIPDGRREAEAWEALEAVRLDIRMQVCDGVRFMQRRELPAPIAAVIWQRKARCAVVTSTVTPRPRGIRAALRAHRSGWAVALIIGWVIVRRAGRGVLQLLAPTATVAAASMAAVTAVATAPPITSVPVLQERGHAIHGKARPSPLGPLAEPRPQPDAAEPEQTAPPAEQGEGQTEVPAPEEPVEPAPPADAPAPTPVPTTPAPPTQKPTPPPTTPPPSDPPASTYDDGGDSPDTTAPEDHAVPAQPCLLGILDCGPIS